MILRQLLRRMLGGLLRQLLKLLPRLPLRQFLGRFLRWLLKLLFRLQLSSLLRQVLRQFLMLLLRSLLLIFLLRLLHWYFSGCCLDCCLCCFFNHCQSSCHFGGLKAFQSCFSHEIFCCVNVCIIFFPVFFTSYGDFYLMPNINDLYLPAMYWGGFAKV